LNNRPNRPIRVILAKPRGFCAGVERAIEIVERALRKYGRPVYVRHEIVHNKHVVEDLRSKGAVFVEELDEIPAGAVTVFSAHGVSEAVENEASLRRLPVIDATCPLVSKVHKQGQRYAEKGHQVILIGHDGHPEVEGTRGRVPGGVLLVSSVTDVDDLEVSDPSQVSYVTQTTLSVDDTREIVQILHERFPALQAPPKDDICYATQNRQDAVKALAQHVDVLLVLGAPNSSNSLRLCEVAEARNLRAHLIETAADIRPEWIDDANVVGLTASASAPEILVQQVIGFARERLGVTDVEELLTVKEDVHFSLPHELDQLEPRSAAAGSS
jgi:4-hydroxy-3-methylbut-2-enyl diphosphate reductase